MYGSSVASYNLPTDMNENVNLDLKSGDPRGYLLDMDGVYTYI